MNFVPILFYCLCYAALNVFGAALIKHELKDNSLGRVVDVFLFLMRWRVITGFGIVFLSALILIKALSLAKISLVNPVATGINFGLTLLVGYACFNERITTSHYAGLLLILTGIVIISIAEKSL